MASYLVTGGAGFIGSNLTKELIKQGNQVCVVDDLSMGKLENLAQIDRNALQFYEHTITDKKFMKELLLDKKFDYIVLLAAVASVADSIARPYETHQVNQEADINILEIIRKYELPVKKVIFSSSAAVYGKLYAIPTVATRFFNVYGPKQNPQSPYSGVLSIITECFKNNSEFTLFGDGGQARDFIYVEDVVSALNLLLRSDAQHDVYNVATGRTATLLDVINEMEKIVGKPLKIKKAPERKGDIRRSQADVAKLHSLGFSAKNDLAAGLKKYLSVIE
ncbi:NAD-dependent epimerase/dehydratase family protein [Liquorilactobacillus oeni]|uniref:NAD dependent epimerase dehydratase family protein n=1 Tax=Liquorilactobacillus oeni DSM 19972 TaxID=1423777 RepID=A0A0R1MH32_9LACO|nr:NAD-dependent epimerase/dehydratase family protein [Liquorilactobacillus oeni]KRL04514.1 NAD dependent epimerase dehydratase family protein [Liquorilactobacillus oeni DSM 19972]